MISKVYQFLKLQKKELLICGEGVMQLLCPYWLNMDISVTSLSNHWFMNVSFTSKQEKYIADQLQSGDYQNASEVVRDALRLHEYFRTRVLDELRTEINKGWDGPVSKRNVQDIIKSKAKK